MAAKSRPERIAVSAEAIVNTLSLDPSLYGHDAPQARERARQNVLAAPRHPAKDVGHGRAQTEQVVAAVQARPEDDAAPVPVPSGTTGREEAQCRDDVLDGKRRHVAPEEHDARRRRERGRRDPAHSRAEIAFALRDHRETAPACERRDEAVALSAAR